MASENIWAIATQESPGAAISKLQIERWSGETDESILVLLNAKISTMLEGITDATERQAATQIRAALVDKRKAVAQKLSAQEPASVSGPGVWRGASGSMLAPYDGERRVRSEGQKGREAFYVYISSLQYSEGKSAQ